MPGPQAGMTAHKHKGKVARDGYLEKVAKLDRRGYTTYQIAEECGVSQTLIHNDLKIIRKRYIESMLTAREELIANKVAQFEEVRREAWDAYERSRKDAEKEVTEYVTQNEQASQESDGSSLYSSEVRIKRIVTREGRLPVNQYLQTVLQTLQSERELLGLDAPKQVKQELSGTVGVVDWAALVQALRGPVRTVEQEVAELLEAPTAEIPTITDQVIPEPLHADPAK